MPPVCDHRRSYRSSSPISIVTGWSSGSSRARARRIGTSFSRRSCSRYCANGGALRARRAGCLPLRPGCFRLPRAAYECAPAASHRSPGSWACRHHQACRRSYAAAQLRPPISWSKRPIFGPARSTFCGRCPASARPLSRPSVEGGGHLPPSRAGWRASHAGHVSLDQLKVMSALERCRTWAFSPRARPVGALGGHVERCEACAHLRISYNSCRDRHCPKCQAAAAKEWLADRQAELLPVPYFHVVFTLLRPIADIAYHNQAIVYELVAQSCRRDPDHDRPHGTSPWAEGPRPQAPRRSHRAHRRIAHLGIDTDPPSARPYDRPRRRHLTRWPALDCLPTRLSSLRPGALTPLPTVCFWKG